jgi:hypothetical protein
MTTTTTTVEAVADKWGHFSAVCPSCGGHLFVNTGHRGGNSRGRVSGWTLASHRHRGAKCPGSGTPAHYTPAIGK